MLVCSFSFVMCLIAADLLCLNVVVVYGWFCWVLCLLLLGFMFVLLIALFISGFISYYAVGYSVSYVSLGFYVGV